MISLFRKFAHPVRGLYIMLRHDRGVQLQVLFLVISLLLINYLFAPISYVEYMFLLVAYGLLFITELQNSALERTLDHLHPERHDEVRDSKDISAASVLTGLLVLLGLVFIFYLERGVF